MAAGGGGQRDLFHPEPAAASSSSETKAAEKRLTALHAFVSAGEVMQDISGRLPPPAHVLIHGDYTGDDDEAPFLHRVEREKFRRASAPSFHVEIRNRRRTIASLPEGTLLLQDFVIKHQCLRVGRDDKREITHTSMAGGTLHVDDADMAELYTSYAKSIFLERKLFLVERPTPRMRMFMDLDFVDQVAIRSHMVLVVVREIQACVASFFHPELVDMEVIVSTAPYKVIEDAAQSPGAAPALMRIKTGVHMTWTRVFCSLPHMRAIRHQVIARLYDTFGRRFPPSNSWDDVVDEAVYRASGFRMIGSFKTVACPDCSPGGKTDHAARRECETCGAAGKVSDGRAYAPMVVLRRDGSRDPEREAAIAGDTLESTIELVQSTVVRVSALEMESKSLPDGALLVHRLPRSVLDEAERDQAGLETGARRKRGRDHAADADPVAAELKARMHGTKLETLDDEPKLETIQRFLRSLHEEWADFVVSRVFVTKSNSYIAAGTKTPSGRYCLNIGKHHASNQIYFIFSNSPREGVTQKCFDEHCREYSSRHYPVSKDVSRELWHTCASVLPLRETLPPGGVSSRVRGADLLLLEKKRRTTAFNWLKSRMQHVQRHRPMAWAAAPLQIRDDTGLGSAAEEAIARRGVNPALLRAPPVDPRAFDARLYSAAAATAPELPAASVSPDTYHAVGVHLLDVACRRAARLSPSQLRDRAAAEIPLVDALCRADEE